MTGDLQVTIYLSWEHMHYCEPWEAQLAYGRGHVKLHLFLSQVPNCKWRHQSACSTVNNRLNPQSVHMLCATCDCCHVIITNIPSLC